MTIFIGDIAIKNPVFLAPMSGVSDLPFRRIVKGYGAGLVFSEMIASHAMIQHNKRSFRMTSNLEDEFPTAVQLAGCDPKIMALAAQMNVDRGAAIIDINFGCPVKKIVDKMAGSALMRDVELATKIMAATVKAVDAPVTVKMRLGWDDNSLNAAELARRAQDVGVKMITVHGRTREQLYKGKADWGRIAAIREVIDIPLIANGDIFTPDDAVKAMEISGANGVMIGRSCYGRPWILRDVIAKVNGRNPPPPPTNKELSDLIISHYDDMIDYYGEEKAVPLARKHISWYISGFNNSASFRARINKIKAPELAKEMIISFLSEQPERKTSEYVRE